MENNNYLGIYLNHDSAFVAVVSHEQNEPEICERFVVSLSESDQEGATFGSLIAQEIESRQIGWRECAVALDCSFYTQHNLYSRFTDVKQISQTIISDAEDEIGTDIEELAVTFNVTKKETQGSRVTVFALKKVVLKNILNDLRSNGFDPVTVEPDAICLSRSFANFVKTDENACVLYAAFTRSNCYLLSTIKKNNQQFARAFLYDGKTELTKLLIREINITKTLPALPAEVTKIYTPTGVRNDELTEMTSIQADDYSSMITAANADLLEDENMAAFFIAAGAAMINFIRTPKIDFRKGFMPYQGKKIIIERSLRIISIALAIVVFAFSIYSTITFYRLNKNVKQIRVSTEKQYSAAMKGKKMGDHPLMTLKAAIGKLQNVKSGKGVGDEKSILGRLMQTLESLNNLPGNVKLKINSISISSTSIRLDGSTGSRKSSNILLDKIKKNPNLKISQVTQKQVGPEDTFIIVIEPVK